MPSLCTAKSVRRYFQTGELPRQGTVCQPDERPFQVSKNTSGGKGLSLEDGVLMEALKELSNGFGKGKGLIW
jgi:hypothetical protein